MGSPVGGRPLRTLLRPGLGLRVETTGRGYDSGIARQEELLQAGRSGHPLVPYKALWGLLLFGWVVSYADRTLACPVVAWMISKKGGFIGDAANPAALGGLGGSMFFLGYMLTQYSGGRVGDQYGHREMIVVSLLWAAVMTAVSGLAGGLVAFVAARVLTGLGEGVFYSNDRTLIINHTPVAKRTLGLGIVIAGLSIGLTLGTILTPLLINWGTSMGMGGDAWKVPFFVFAAATFVVVMAALAFFCAKVGGAMRSVSSSAGRVSSREVWSSRFAGRGVAIMTGTAIVRRLPRSKAPL